MEKRMILRVILIVVILYVCAVIWMWARQEKYLFLPKHGETLPEFERFRWDRTVNGVRHQGWFLDKGKAKTVIYYGGNAEDLAGHCEEMMAELDANILMINYRGYGQSEGTPGEKELVADSIVMFDLFCAEKNSSPSNICLMGRSLGCGVAVQVATARPEIAGIILVTPFESIAALAHAQYPWLPIKGLLRHSFRAIDYAPEIKMPALVVLAEFDDVIPSGSGRKLGEALGGPKEFVTLPMSHNDINEHPGYFEAVNRFINR
ncbi:MAG: alpha/beta hydrolase [Kiritimatiellales bacterium]